MARWKAWRGARAGGMGLDAGLGGEACKEASYTTKFLPRYTQTQHRQAASGIQGAGWRWRQLYMPGRSSL